MTEQLFYENSHLYEFKAQITGIVEDDGETAVLLNQTAFFPEGGGQKSDVGYIGKAEVYDVQTVDGEILHYCRHAETLAVGETYECCLNRELRFARMQAHSGEHIVSGIAHTLYGVENVGFHMDGLLMTVDFSQYLDKEQLSRVEAEANGVIYKNLPVKAWFPNSDELKTLDYRSKLENIQNTRIVTVEGVDNCACCAPHVNFTGEIGIIKILSSVSHRGGVRLTLICGECAYRDYAEKHMQLLTAADLLKVKHSQTADAVGDLLLKNAELKREVALQKTRLCNFVAASVTYSEKAICLFVDGFSPDELRELAWICKEKSGVLFSVFSGNDENGYAYAASSQHISLKAPVKQWHTVLGGRGGGRDELVGGKVDAAQEAIRNYFNSSEVNAL